MATISDLVAKLKLRANIDPAERLSPSASLDDFLASLIEDAVTDHNPSYTVAALPAAEEQLVLILAHIEICYVRASHFVNTAPIQAAGGAFTQQLDSPFNKNMKLAQQLAVRYDELIQKLGVSSGTGNVITQSTIYKKSDRLDRIFPYFNVPYAPPSILKGTPQNSTDILFDWIAKPVDYFYRNYFFWCPTPGIYQAWNGVGVMTVPRIKSSATLFYTTFGQSETEILAQGFPASSVVYAMLVTQTQQSKYTYSDEIKVTLP